MNRNILLTIAIVLAACINGILAYDISLCDREIAAVAAEAPKIAIESAPETTVPEVAATEDVDVEVLIVQPPTTIRCYPAWEYRRFQPVRNLVRFFHNRRPLRSWWFGRYCC